MLCSKRFLQIFPQSHFLLRGQLIRTNRNFRPHKMSRNFDLNDGLTELNKVDIPVLLQDESFLIVDKPYDLRMDGNEEITLEKILHAKYDEDKTFKWVHQLDHATSGVLCIGLNRPATAMAAKAFFDRVTSKEYLAIVYGHVRFDEQWPIITPSDVERIRQYNQTDHKPIHDTNNRKKIKLDHTWQHGVMEKALQSCYDILMNLPLPSESSHPDYTELKELQGKLFQDYTINARLRKRLRKFLKKLDILPSDLSFDQPIDDQGDEGKEDDKLRSGSSSQYQFNYDWSISQNRIYTVKSSTDVSIKQRILVTIPVAEVENEFSCELSCSHNPGRYAETEIEILTYGYYQGQKVTKLRLYPRTGRRHQLRLHCLALGHPIVGDITYAVKEESYKVMDAERMMLHAFKLKIPLEEIVLREPERKIVPPYTLETTTADPFDQYLSNITQEPDIN